MQVVHTVEALRDALAPFNSPAFVPTMGNLHDGHLALVRHAKPLGDVTVASIFVNRLQFLPHEDFDTYPRTLERDCGLLESAGCDVVFAPSEHDLYPSPQTYKIAPPAALADILEGHFRPGFFTGVSTVVMKLFQCVFSQAKGPRHAVFGKKDYQQFMVLRHLVNQFAMPISLHGVDTLRADDGLALSSRNGYLSAQERQEAIALSVALRQLAAEALTLRDRATEADWAQQLAALETRAQTALDAQGWATDYLTVRRRDDLQSPAFSDAVAGRLVTLGASKLGSTRLIDNLEF